MCCDCGNPCYTPGTRNHRHGYPGWGCSLSDHVTLLGVCGGAAETVAVVTGHSGRDAGPG